MFFSNLSFLNALFYDVKKLLYKLNLIKKKYGRIYRAIINCGFGDNVCFSEFGLLLLQILTIACLLRIENECM